MLFISSFPNTQNPNRLLYHRAQREAQTQPSADFRKSDPEEILLVTSQLNSYHVVKPHTCQWQPPASSDFQIPFIQLQWLRKAACSKGCGPSHRLAERGGSGANCPGTAAEPGGLSAENSAGSADSAAHVTLSILLVLKLLLQCLSMKFSTANNRQNVGHAWEPHTQILNPLEAQPNNRHLCTPKIQVKSGHDWYASKNSPTAGHCLLISQNLGPHQLQRTDETSLVSSAEHLPLLPTLRAPTGAARPV